MNITIQKITSVLFRLRLTRLAVVMSWIEYLKDVSIAILVKTVRASSLISQSSSSHLKIKKFYKKGLLKDWTRTRSTGRSNSSCVLASLVQLVWRCNTQQQFKPSDYTSDWYEKLSTHETHAWLKQNEEVLHTKCRSLNEIMANARWYFAYLNQMKQEISFFFIKLNTVVISQFFN